MGRHTKTNALIAATALALALAGCASEGEPGGRNATGGGGTTAPPLPSAGAGNAGAGGSTAPSAGSSGAAGGGGTAAPAGGSGGGTTGASGSSAAGTEASAGSSAAAGDVDCSALTLPDNYDDVISTFEDATGATNQVEGRGGGFFMYNDMTGTQMPAPGALPPAENTERCDSQYALCMSGSGFTEWGAGMGTDLGPTDADGNKTPFDASEYSGIAFWARIGEGSTPLVRVSLKDSNTAPEGGVCDENETSGATACNDDWGKSLNITKEWKAYTIRFDEMQQSNWGAQYDQFEQSAVYGIQWQVGPNLDFDLCIDDVMLVR